jgi:hypothetical protein
MQTNTQAHLGPQSATKKQSFMTLVPGRVDHLEGRHHHPAEAVGHVPRQVVQEEEVVDNDLKPLAFVKYVTSGIIIKTF